MRAHRYGVAYQRCLASLAIGRGEIGQTIEHLTKAARLAEEIGLPGELWPILEALGERHDANGDRDKAGPCYIQAASIVRELAERIGDVGRRTAFLQSEAVARVLGK